MAKKKVSQKTRILDYLRTHKKGMTPLDAWQKCGVYRAAAVICELRKDGYNITTGEKIVYNKFGEECRVAEYELWE